MDSVCGVVSFCDYMAWNNKRYYSSAKKLIGKEGDFYTSPYVHSAFGSALARQIAQCWKILGGPDTYTIFEFGGGSGKLACAVLDALEQNCHPCYKATEYIISDYHARSQNGNNRWKQVQPFSKKFISYPFTGIVLAHEFVDALPVHRVVRRADRLQEIMVNGRRDFQGDFLGNIAEEEMPLSTPLLESFFKRLGMLPPINCQADVNLEAIDWLQWVGSNMDRGFVITIDYGDLAEYLFTEDRSFGTVRGFYRHELLSDLYKYPGGQDLTASVNFSSLIEFGEEFGLTPTGFTHQMYFLLGADILSLVPPEELTTIKRLILPDGMGDTYKVLIQHKGCFPPTLDGLSLRTIPVC